ncbi:MAG: hypothetical protein MMC23_000713 [Stictis urceolatum]|nr:hypothetical protein [Stictis urceolata]
MASRIDLHSNNGFSHWSADVGSVTSYSTALAQMELYEGDADSQNEFTEKLLFWARQIRDEVVPRMVEEGYGLTESEEPEAIEVLKQLAKYEISADMLRTSRIHLALREMNAADAWKNDESRYQSDILLLKWETRFGSLRKLTINIWADGGRMANVAKLRESASESVPKGLFKASWSVLRSAENANTLALKTGDLDFAVGSWWIKPAAACRDGIIDSLDGITADGKLAYAIVLDDTDELESGLDGRLVYRPAPSQLCRTRLMKSLTSRFPVRVLRSYKLFSPLKPLVGLRYDGLYGIKSIGTKLQVRVENPLMVYTFTMKRLEGQESLRTAMRHPTAEERDDWRIYQRYKHRHLVLPSEVDLSKPGQFILPGSAQSSSFNSRRASAFTTIGPLPDDAGDYFAVQKRKQDTQDNLDEDVISPGDVSRPRSMD